MSGIILPGREHLELPEHAATDLILPDEARKIREAEHAEPPARELRPCPAFGFVNGWLPTCTWIRTVKEGKGRVGPWKCLFCQRPR